MEGSWAGTICFLVVSRLEFTISDSNNSNLKPRDLDAHALPVLLWSLEFAVALFAAHGQQSRSRAVTMSTLSRPDNYVEGSPAFYKQTVELEDPDASLLEL